MVSALHPVLRHASRLLAAKSAAFCGRGLGPVFPWILPGANFAEEHGGELYALIVARRFENSQRNPRSLVINCRAVRWSFADGGAECEIKGSLLHRPKSQRREQSCGQSRQPRRTDHPR